MKTKLLSSRNPLCTVILIAAASIISAKAASFTSTSATTAWNTGRWNNTADGPSYTSAYTANNDVSFTSGTYSFAGMGASINVGNITVASGVTVNFPTLSNSLATNGTVRTIDVGSGGLFDFNGLSLSTAAGTGFNKTGSGVLGTGAGAFTGGFTLTAGTVVARGTTGMGSGATNTLVLNGGTFAANATRAFDNTRFGAGITIGGNVQFGELATVVSIANSTANLSFANNVALGAATRTLTIGNNGTTTFSGIISGTTGTGLSISANSGTTGRIIISGLSNTYDGPTTINSGILSVTGSLASGSAVTVKNTGTLAGSGTVSGTVAVNNGGVVGAGDAAIGTLSTGAATLDNGSIFSWDIATAGATYDKLVAPSLTDGGTAGGSVFRVVAADTTFSNAFWNTTKTFTDIFTTNGTSAIADWANIFNTVTVVDGTFTAVDVSVRGSFSASGNTLTWTAIPEPTSAFAGLLIAAGLLRRRSA